LKHAVALYGVTVQKLDLKKKKIDSKIVIDVQHQIMVLANKSSN